jgi:hypothetical protein
MYLLLATMYSRLATMSSLLYLLCFFTQNYYIFSLSLEVTLVSCPFSMSNLVLAEFFSHIAAFSYDLPYLAIDF